MRRKPVLLALSSAALLAAGCEGTATAPADAALGASDVALLAEGLDALTGAMLVGELGALAGLGALPDAAAPVPVERSFSTTRPCPAGGSVAVSGAIRGEVDVQARSLALETSATKTPSACAFPARRAGGVALTIDGSPGIAVKSSVKAVAGVPSGPQSTTQKGGFTWTASDGRSGACTLDLVSTLDPAARTYTLKGSLCGQPVDVTRQG